MPRMTFSIIYSRIETIVNLDSGYRNLIKDAIQWALDLIGSKHNWPYLIQEGVIPLTAPYETGTVDVTNNSATVSGTGTTFTEAMEGRKIRIGTDKPYYRIKTFVSVTEITLETVYQGDTDTGLSYSIFKDEYKLPPNLDRYKIMRDIEEEKALIDVGDSAFDIAEPSLTSEGSPDYVILSCSKLDIYDTGTVSGTVGNSTITGSSTSWTSVNGLGKSSRITVGSVVYTVKSVDSDTQITIYEDISSAFSGSAYTILLDNLIIQFFETPDELRNIYFRYQRIPEIIYDDTDIPDLPDQWHWLLIDGGLGRAWEVKDKEEAKAKKLEFLAGIEEMKKAVGSISQHLRIPKRSIESDQYPLGPRHPSGYGVPFSP